MAELITKKPFEGWDEDVEKVRAVIKDDAEVLDMFRKAMRTRKGKRTKAEQDNTDNVSIKTNGHGISKSYTFERLACESPELFEQV